MVKAKRPSERKGDGGEAERNDRYLTEWMREKKGTGCWSCCTGAAESRPIPCRAHPTRAREAAEQKVKGKRTKAEEERAEVEEILGRQQNR